MNDIDNDLQQLEAAFRDDDQDKGLGAIMRLVAGFLKDVRRIADALSSRSGDGK